MGLNRLKGIPLAGAFLGLLARLAAAQVDYRNLDDDRPTLIEDAYPIERWAFELLGPWRFERERGGLTRHLAVPELAYGIAPNAQLGLKVPVAGVAEPAGDREWGIAGLRLFGLHNFNTESLSLPALSLRADLGLPVGPLGGEELRVGLKGIATRSWGRYRLHLNASYAVGGGDGGEGEPLPRWSGGAAVDRTLFRQSLLLVAETYVMRLDGGYPTEAVGGIGLRKQLAPTVVLDLGLSRRLGRHGPDVAATVGLSHAFALAWLMPRPPPQPIPGGA